MRNQKGVAYSYNNNIKLYSLYLILTIDNCAYLTTKNKVSGLDEQIIIRYKDISSLLQELTDSLYYTELSIIDIQDIEKYITLR